MVRKGFTLIEVLIVVVIIAVLASLILPRFMGQSERAVIGEAQQMLGAMRRGQIRWQDMASSPGETAPIDLCGPSEACDASQWALIGVSPPSGGSFDYACTSAAGDGICYAQRVGRNGAIALVVRTGHWSCADGYTELPNNRGCTAGGGNLESSATA